jgi:hypothetical protein
MDALPDEIIIAFEKFLPIPDSINLGKTSSRLHALARYGRRNLIMAKKSMLDELKQIEYLIKPQSYFWDGHGAPQYMGIRLFPNGRISLSQWYSRYYKSSSGGYDQSHLWIINNVYSIPKYTDGCKVTIDYCGTITFTSTINANSGYEYLHICRSVSNHNKCEKKPDILENLTKKETIKRMILGLIYDMPTEYQIIDKFPCSL